MVLERAHKLVHLFSPFVRVVLLCAADFAPTSPTSGAKIVGGFLRSEKPIFLFFSLFSASFSCCFFLFRWRARAGAPLEEISSVGPICHMFVIPYEKF